MAEVMKKHQEADEGFFKVLLMGTTATQPNRQGLETAYRKLAEAKQSIADMTKCVMRMSVYGLQAKRWDDQRYCIDLSIFNVKRVAVAGRAVVFVARDSGQVDTPTPAHTLYAIVCENPKVSHEVARRLTQICTTIAASLRAIKSSNSLDLPNSFHTPLKKQSSPAPDAAEYLETVASTPEAAEYLNVMETTAAPADVESENVVGDVLQEMALLLEEVRALNLLPQEIVTAEGRPSRVAREAQNEPEQELNDIDQGRAPATLAYVRQLSKRMLVPQASSSEIVFTQEEAPQIKKAVLQSSKDYAPPTKF